MSTVASLRYAYATAFDAYLAESSEDALHAAYELGRDAVARELSVLDLAAVHHEAVRTALNGEDATRVADAAAQFFLEALSAFEMLQRGFRETQEAARAEQRQAAAIRQLSSFLGDASLAFEEAESIEEMLQLVSEQARELLEADCCVVYATIDDARFEAVSGTCEKVSDRRTLAKLTTLLRGRMSEADLAADPAAVALGGLLGRPLRGVLAAGLTALDGREVGSIHLFDPHGREFTDVDEAQLLHLTQLASAALERVALYGRGRRVGEALRRARRFDACAAPGLEVVVRRHESDSGGAVWLDGVVAADRRLVVVAGEVRGPAPVVAAAQARAAAAALLAAGVAPGRLLAELGPLLGRLAPDNPARTALAVVGAERVDTAVDGAGEATVALGDDAALVLHVGAGPPGVSVEGGSAAAAADRMLAALRGREAEAVVVAVARRA